MHTIRHVQKYLPIHTHFLISCLTGGVGTCKKGMEKTDIYYLIQTAWIPFQRMQWVKSSLGTDITLSWSAWFQKCWLSLMPKKCHYIEFSSSCLITSNTCSLLSKCRHVHWFQSADIFSSQCQNRMHLYSPATWIHASCWTTHKFQSSLSWRKLKACLFEFYWCKEDSCFLPLSQVCCMAAVQAQLMCKHPG